MISYPIFAELIKKMQAISSLTPLLQKGAGNFYCHSLELLQDLQNIADKNQLYFCTEIALTIEKMLCHRVEQSQNATTRANPRKERDIYAVNCIEQLFKEIKSFIEKDRKVFDECGDLWRQVLARLIAKGFSVDKMDISNQEKLDYIVYNVRQDSELLPYYIHIQGLLGNINLQIILDITLPQLNL